MAVIARYDASYAGVDAYGEIAVTENEAVSAMAQTDAYIHSLVNDYNAWVDGILDKRTITPAERSLYNSFASFVSAWASFWDNNVSGSWMEAVVMPLTALANSISFSMSTRSVRDTSNGYLDQAAQWRDRLISTGASVNTPGKPPPAGTGGLFQWPSLGDVPWWVWALGASAVALWLGLPQAAIAALRGGRSTTRALTKGA